MKKHQRILAATLALILVLVLSACGASSSMDMGTTASENVEMPTYDTAISNTSLEESGFSAYDDSSGSEDAKAAVQTADKIIYSGSATVETQKFEETVAAVEKLADDIGGYIQSSNVNGSDFYASQYGDSVYRSAYYELRVPADKFRYVMDGLSSLGNVPYSSINADNITEQYTDVQARLNSCQAEETRLLALLDKADTVEEMLQIESYLSDVRYEIESYTAQIKNWDSRISYSTISLSIQEVSLYTDSSPANVSYGKQLSTSLKGSAKAVWHFLKNFLKFIVAALPVLAVLAVIAVPVFFIVRRAVRKRKSRKEKSE